MTPMARVLNSWWHGGDRDRNTGSRVMTWRDIRPARVVTAFPPVRRPCPPARLRVSEMFADATVQRRPSDQVRRAQAVSPHTTPSPLSAW